MATNISYILMHKSKFFETFLNNLQTVSIEYRKQLKKVGILRVKSLASAMAIASAMAAEVFPTTATASATA